MNLLGPKFDGCAPRRYVSCQAKAIDLATRCYGGGSSSSSTSQPVTNQQVGLQTGAGAGVAVGAGASTGAINISTLDDAQLQALLDAGGVSLGQLISGGNTALSTGANVATTAVASNQFVTNAAISGVNAAASNAVTSNQLIANSAIAGAGQAIVAAQGQAEHSEDIVSSIAGQAITTGAQTAQSLGGAAINAGAQLGVAGLTAGNNLATTALAVTNSNLNALNQNTAEAFSVLASMETSQQSGAVSGEAQDLLSLANKLSTASSAAPTVIYQPVDTSSGQQPYTGTAATGSGVQTTTLVLIAAAIAAVIFGPKLLKQTA